MGGYLLSFALFELVAIPCMMKIQYDSFQYTYSIYKGIMLAFALAGLLVTFHYNRGKMQRNISLYDQKTISHRRLRHNFEILFPGSKAPTAEDIFNPRKGGTIRNRRFTIEAYAYWCAFYVLLGLQLYMAITRASFDGDDSYYVTESRLAQQAGVMNTILPYTGSSTSLDIRHALAVITMWIAFIAKALGVHSTIVSHTLIPLVFIPLTYMVYFQIARLLFPRNKDTHPIFLVILEVIQIFGNTSIYTSETFFLTRTWQGKSLVANLILPLLLWLFLWIAKDLSSDSEKNKSEKFAPWILMLLVNMTAGICSSMGVILGTVLIMAYVFVLLIRYRKWSVVGHGIFACLPNLVYVMLYLSIIG